APGVGLGHRRLSIIDLGGGAQPMASADGALTVSYNGEIYNFQAVRAELEAKGARFRTNSDTEVLLHGWAAWGPAMLDRLNGMFAFALHDARTQSLFLARDRLGVKPLHYVMLSDGGLAFASELKGLLAHPLVRRAPDIRAVEDYLAFGYVPDDTCLVAGVQKLAAGHSLLIERGKPMPAPVQWWDIDFSRRATGSVASLSEELIALMRAGVESRMLADVPLGAFLSGGVDSSAVVALMAAASKRAVKTCTIGFDAADYDERRYANQIATLFAADHREKIVAADDFALIDTLVAAFDEPFADASALATYRVCELARETVTVALSGDGADEALAGYRRYKFQAAEEQIRALIPAQYRAAVFGKLGALYPKADWAPRMFRAKTTLLGLADDGATAYARSVGVTTPALRGQLFSDAARRALGGHVAEARYVETMRTAPAREALDRAQYADFKHWLPGDILTKVDRTSMAVSLEAREPLLDYKLIEFAATLPVSMRIRAGEGKWIMKKAMERYLPRDILYRQK
ncbi:MAG: asparagine synthase (glutamine-hydrolyzing), partial [Sphingomonas sp.]|nr:asparagine synthase (glutamine-hydrolyzing) [Sphingomonas sp.]